MTLACIPACTGLQQMPLKSMDTTKVGRWVLNHFKAAVVRDEGKMSQQVTATMQAVISILAEVI